MFAVLLAAALLIFEWILIGTPWGHYLRVIDDSGLLRAGLRAGLLLLALGLHVAWCAVWLSARRPLRATLLLVFAGILWVQYGYVQATGGFITGHDFEVALGAPMHWHAVALHFSSLWALVPVAAGAVVLAVAPPASRPASWRHVAGLLALTFVGHALYVLPQSLGPTGRNEFIHEGQPLVSTQSFARAIVQFGTARVMGVYQRRQRGDRARVPTLDLPPPSRHIVLVVDESIRADHLSLNGYHRETTPFLEHLAADEAVAMANWGTAASSTPYSNDSVLSLLTGVRRLPDRDLHTLLWPTIFDYAKAAGYTTHWFDGGGWHRRFGFSANDFAAVDDWRTRTRFGDDSTTDDRIADAVADLLTSREGRFIVVLKRGNHIPFIRNYPPGDARWQPDQRGPGAGDATPLARLVNSYDNAVRFGVDRFLERVLRDRDVLARTVLIYTSDHGQALRRIQLGGPMRHMYWEDVAVPLLMFGDPAREVDTGYPAHHANVLPTVLDLFGIPDAARGGPYARSLLTATAADRDTRYVFTGDFFGFGPFLRADFDQLRDDVPWLPPVARDRE